jgi:hypothetical protein
MQSATAGHVWKRNKVRIDTVLAILISTPCPLENAREVPISKRGGHTPNL